MIWYTGCFTVSYGLGEVGVGEKEKEEEGRGGGGGKFTIQHFVNANFC